MPSVWIRTRTTKNGSKRFLVEYRPGGREATVRHGGSFGTKRLATIRAAAIERELAALRMPTLMLTCVQSATPTFETAARAWQESRLDIAASTRDQHRIQLDKLLPLIGTRPIDRL